MYHNIEKVSKNHDYYVGYGLGNVWRIRRHSSRWVAYPQLPDERGILPNAITRKLLRDISQALSPSHPGRKPWS